VFVDTGASSENIDGLLVIFEMGAVENFPEGQWLRPECGYTEEPCGE